MYDADMTPSAARKFDLSSTEISIAEDVTNQLPEVVRQQNGVLALIDRDDPSIARYIFAPPDWAFKDGIVDVSDMIRISMAPASKWKLLRSLAERYSIDLDRYQVCALFQTAYARCLDREIRNRADAQPGRGRVKSASLVFTSARTCGIDVLNVQFVDP